jgi:hypothetical protein
MTLFGIFYLSPWLHEMAAITAADPIGALQNETFLTKRWQLSLSGGPMFLAMFFLVFISVIKPWSGRAKSARAGRTAAPREAAEQPLVMDCDHCKRRAQLGAQQAQISDGADGVPGGRRSARNPSSAATPSASPDA